jgi:ABC-2 type transport system permease protein
MTDTPLDGTPLKRNLLTRLADNPVIIKELRGRMRSRRAFVLLSIYLSVISLLVGIVYILIASEQSYGYWDPEIRQAAGKAIFSTVVLLELSLISFIGPALTSGAITSERERDTYDLLRTTLLSARSLAFGKLGTSVIYLCLLILTALPIESLAFFLGGVGMGELLLSNFLLVVNAIFFCALGLFYSSFTKRTTVATIASYTTILLSVLVLVLFYFVLVYLLDSLGLFGTLAEDLLISIAWILVSTNPLLTAIVTELILVEDQSYFFTTSIFGSSHPALSPWIPFTVIYLGLAALMVFLSIKFVDRPDR